MLTVNAETTEELWREWIAYVNQRRNQSNRLPLVILFTLIGFAIGFLFAVVDNFDPTGFFVAFAMFIIWLIIVGKMQSQVKFASDFILAPRLISIRDDGLHVDFNAASTVFNWPYVKEIVQSKNLLILMFDQTHCVAIPFDCFESDAHEEEFTRALRKKCSHLKKRDSDYDDYRD